MQKSFRLHHSHDIQLIDWMSSYAKQYKQTDLIRLALYALSGLDTPTDLPKISPVRTESPTTVVSNGIDTSRPRPPKRTTGAKKAPIAIEPPAELSNAEQLKLTKLLVNSIKNAQPGRIEN